MCDTSTGLQIFYLLKIAFQILCIVLPIIIIITMTISLFKYVVGSEEKIIMPNIKKIIAALIIFILPSLFGYLFTNFNGNENDFMNCFNIATPEKVKALQEKEKLEAEQEKAKQDKENKEAMEKAAASDEEERQKQKKLAEDWAKKYGSGSCLRFDQYEGDGTVKSQFSTKTLKIVEEHLNDFDYTNYHTIVPDVGEYITSLGGVFADYWDNDEIEVYSASELQKVSEYVFGLMYIYGFDYWNGYHSNGHYCKWGGKCTYNCTDSEHCSVTSSGTADAFYTGSYAYKDHGLSAKNDFDKLISGDNMTVNCNWAVDMVFYKAGIFGENGDWQGGSASPTAMAKKFGVIESMEDYEVGDIVHFFDHTVDRGDYTTWSGWRHVAFVGEVDKEEGIITFYDGGSYFTNTRNFKWTAKIDDSTTKLHGYSGWGVVRVRELAQDC